jgi:hypothetical protein
MDGVGLLELRTAVVRPLLLSPLLVANAHMASTPNCISRVMMPNAWSCSGQQTTNTANHVVLESTGIGRG